MNSSLTINSIMDYGEKIYPNVDIVSVTADNPRHRYTYKDAFARVRQLANALAAQGFKKGDRIATMAWNDHRHFELYYATSCSGFVCHTINPRLFSEQLKYIINHAEDQFIFIDPAFVPVIEDIISALPTIKGCIVLTDDANMPEQPLKTASLTNVLLRATVTNLSSLNWMKMTRVHCVIPLVPPVTRRVYFIATALRCYTA